MSEFQNQGLTNIDLRKQSIETTVQFLKKKELMPKVKEFDIGI